MAKTIIKNTMEDPIEMTCEDCQSVFTYNYQDICRDVSRNILGFETIHRYVTCPVCKHDNNLTVLKIVKEKETDPVESEKNSEEEEIYCTECPYFEDVVDDARNWFGALCKKDGHESSPSMYAIQSLHNDCPLKKQEEKTDEL